MALDMSHPATNLPVAMAEISEHVMHGHSVITVIKRHSKVG